jgi:Flagellar biosynthesis protein, FliO
MRRERNLWLGTVNFMTTAALRVSAGGFRERMGGLWERILRLGGRAPRRLRLCENLPLGERRFVAVVEFDRARFLVGGTPSSLVLLSRLADAGDHAGDQSENEAAAGRPAGDAAAAKPAAWQAVSGTPKRSETC